MSPSLDGVSIVSFTSLVWIDMRWTFASGLTQMQTGGERFRLHFAEKIDNSHVPGRNDARRAQQQKENENKNDKRDRRSPRSQARQLTQSNPKLSKVFAD
jgi:hypothetical protein